MPRADDASAEAQQLRLQIERARSSLLSDAPPIAAERADELVAAVYAARRAR